MQVLIRNRTMRVNARAARALIRAGLARELVAAPAATTASPVAAVPTSSESQARPRRIYRRRDIEQAPEAVVLQAETMPDIEDESEPSPEPSPNLGE